MANSRVQQVLEALQADFKRQEDRLTLAQVERLVLKRDLSPLEVRDVFRGLEALHIHPEQPEEFHPDHEGDEILPCLSDGLDFLIRAARAREFLSPKEELECGRRIRLSQQARKHLSTSGERAADYEEIIQRGEEARQRLVNANLLLVLAWARKYQVISNYELSDLFQDGVIGLIKAAERFDFTLGLRFTTYAVWWIRQSITRALSDRGRIVRIPVHRVEQIQKFKRAVRMLRHQFGVEEPTLQSVSELLNWSLEFTSFISVMANWTNVSLDEPLAGDVGDDVSLGDVIPSHDPSALALVEVSERRERVLALLDNLPPAQKNVLLHRFGFTDDDEGETLQDIGEQMGLTRERIRQIEEKALGKIGKRAKKQRLNEVF